MPSDVESKLRYLGTQWTETIPHVTVDEVLGGDATGSVIRWETDEFEPVRSRPRFGWVLAAAAALVVVMIGPLIVLGGGSGDDSGAPATASEAPVTEQLPVNGISVAEATVTDRKPAGGGERFDIDLGTDDGLRVGMPVVDASGLVGRIVTVSNKSSEVLSVLSPDYTVGVAVLSDEGDGAGSEFTGRGDGGTLALSNPSPTVDLTGVRVGDSVETAGGPEWPTPPGIPIGIVINVRLASPPQLDVELHSGGEIPGSVRVLLYVPSLVEPETSTPLVDPVLDQNDQADPSPSTAVRNEPFALNRSPVILGDEFGTALFEPLEQLGFEVDDQGVESSGLARPSFYDWPSNLTEILEPLPAGTPVVATFGGNDTQVLVRADETIVAPIDDPLWAPQYRARVDAVMNEITTAGHPLVWVGVPTPPDRYRAAIREVRSITIAAAAANDQVTYIDTWDILETENNDNPGSAELQSPDEYHLSATGGRLVAAEVAAVLEDM